MSLISAIQSRAAALGLAAAVLVGAAAPALAAGAYATTTVNVRSCGSTDCRVVDVLRRGERVDVDYCKGAWCAVEKRGRDGWVNANYLSRDDWDDDDYWDDDYIIVEPRRHVIRRYNPDFSACIGGPNARFCIYD